MNLSFSTFKRKDPHRPHRLIGAQTTNTKILLTRGLLSVMVSVGLAGWLQEPVKAETFGPLADGDVTGLIDTIQATNANGEPDTILLADNGTYTLSPSADARIPFADVEIGNSGLPSFTSTITILGNGAVIARDQDSTAGRFRIILVRRTGNLTLEDVTIQNGRAQHTPRHQPVFTPNSGGGIFNDRGTLNLTHSTVQDNFAYNGGGIYNISGTVTLTHSTIHANLVFPGHSDLGGGGILSLGRHATVTLTNSTVSENGTLGVSFGEGGGILNSGRLILTNSTVSGNGAIIAGGGILNRGGGIALLTHSTVRENFSEGRGSGIFNDGGTATLTHSTVNGNTGTGINNREGTATLTHSTVSDNESNDTGGGSGIRNRSNGTVYLTNSTVSGNARGGIITSGGSGTPGGTVSLANSTVSGNAGTGIFIGDKSTGFLTNTIVADQAVGEDCGVSTSNPNFAGTLTSNDFNLDSDGTCHLNQPHDKPNNPNANLGPLQVTAPGTTATHTLLEDSAAIDMGNCSGGTITDDQRGVPRPQGAACDIGAFELEGPLLCTPPPAPDLNHDGVVNSLDVAQVSSCVGQDPTASAPCQVADLNDDGMIDTTDVNLVRSDVGPICPQDSDLNQDGVVNILDVSLVGSCMGEDPTASAPCQVADLNDDGTIDLRDVNFVTSRVGQSEF